MKGSQRKYLRGLAHPLNPAVMVGKDGVDAGVMEATVLALADHELIKVKFVDHKEEKKALAAHLAQGSGSELVGLIGHTALFYRQQPDPKKRKITLPA